ncbi:chemotaxis protein CheW [Robertmurraya andreesenii]|uniref:Purine-binding chemotaxis protein CheW n=1 Tax=Anoxybacillus andreesenii TaxID=1325932 RepID=A0ABT9V698_9BACL|nr:chemotaxis protein CheW [Robertmurraya andreesenii]MDQ0156468.1 purine-binding chemotaxis protein CheW [Robertmurraya andreesenii]
MNHSNKIVVFTVGNEEYAVPIDHVLSIEKVEGITPIPHLPSYVSGIIRVRGELIPVLDAEKILYHRSISASDSVRMIVLQTSEMSLGILVRNAKEILDIPEERIKQVGLVAYQKTSYFSGVVNLESRLITLISPTVLVKSLEGIREIQEYMQSQIQK